MAGNENRSDHMISGRKHKPYLQACIWALILLGVTASLASFSHASEIDAIRMAIEAKGARWVAKENPISLLPKEERAKKLGLIKPFGLDLPVRASLSPPVGLPSSLDWRDYTGDNYVTPVRDQGGCGSCWAFSTTAALESYTLIANATPGIDLDLAEQILLSCSGAGNCDDGGIPEYAAEFIRDTGLPLETCYLYTATDGNCSNACPNWQSSAYTIPSWQYVATYAPTVNALKEGLFTYGPLPTTMAVYTDFWSYDGGVYSHTSGILEGYHAVLLVGYNDEEQYFIVKNSWNTWWGESGYFRIAYSEVGGVVEFGEFTIAYGTGGPSNNVSVLAPNGGEPVPSGSTYTIQWGAPPGTAKFTVRYSTNNGVTWKTIAKNVTENSYNWSVPKPSGNKKKCLIKVTGYDETGTVKISEDVSDAPFIIEVIRLGSPNGGETLSSGDQTQIGWIRNQTVRPVAKVRLYYTKNNGITWTSIKGIKGNPASAPWTVPAVAGSKSNCKVKVVLLDASGYSVGSDVSDGTFTIDP
jgi:C1A family cysteine protease